MWRRRGRTLRSPFRGQEEGGRVRKAGKKEALLL